MKKRAKKSTTANARVRKAVVKVVATKQAAKSVAKSAKNPARKSQRPAAARKRPPRKSTVGASARNASIERAAGLLPAAFADLAKFVPMWALPSSDARFRQRLNSTAGQRVEFYRAMAPRGADALEFLDRNPWDPERMTDAERNLMRLMLALAEVSLSEEINGQAVEAVHAQSNRCIVYTKEIDSL